MDSFWKNRKKLKNDCFLAIFGLILAMFLTFEYHFTPRSFHPISFHPTFISPQVHFTPGSFHPRFISPHVHLTPNSFHPTLKSSNASQINDYCHPISILALIEKRLGSNYQLDKQTMLAMWTTKSEPKSFTYRNWNTSDQGAQKNHFFCQSKSTTMDAANFQQKIPIPFSYGKKFPTGQKPQS